MKTIKNFLKGAGIMALVFAGTSLLVLIIFNLKILLIEHYSLSDQTADLAAGTIILTIISGILYAWIHNEYS